MKNKLNIFFVLFSAFFLSLPLTGCGVHKPFVPMEGAIVVRPTTIAIISGNSDDASQHLAELLSQELSKRTAFKVMGQEEISRKLGKYPVNLAMVDAFEQERPIWILPAEKKKLDAMQKSLKSDYLFVLWCHKLSRLPGGFTNAPTFYITYVGNLYQYPGGRAIAFTYDQNDRSQSFLGAFKGDGYDIEKLLQDSAERVTDDFIKTVNIGK